jgi:uncharacterized membrane protein
MILELIKLNKLTKLILTFILLFIFDLIFLYLSKKIFNKQVILIQGKPIKIKLVGFIITYLIMMFGYYYFILKDKKSTIDAFIYGIITYGIFEFTNYTIFDNWHVKTIIIDVSWGAILHAIITYIYNNLL